MPKVISAKRNAGGKKTYTCLVCQQEIKPGERYYHWSFRFGGTRRQHIKHGYPKQSQLTQSKMAEIWSVVEDLQSFGTLADNVADMKAEAVSALKDAKSVAEEVALEYEDAIYAMPASEEQNRERIDAIETYVDQLEGAISEVENYDEPEEDYDEEELEDYLEQASAAISEIVTNVASEFSE